MLKAELNVGVVPFLEQLVQAEKRAQDDATAVFDVLSVQCTGKAGLTVAVPFSMSSAGYEKLIPEDGANPGST